MPSDDAEKSVAWGDATVAQHSQQSWEGTEPTVATVAGPLQGGRNGRLPSPGKGNDTPEANRCAVAPGAEGEISEEAGEVACGRCGAPGYWRLGEVWHCATCQRILAGLPPHPWQRDPLGVRR